MTDQPMYRKLPEITEHAGLFPDALTVQFHDHYRRQSATVGPPHVRWLGHEALKCPLDLWIYQEILADYRPDLVIECGTAAGGTSLFLASVLDALGAGHVLSVDIDAGDGTRPPHRRLTYAAADTLSPACRERLAASIHGRTVLILDDGHSAEHVAAELASLAPLLSPGDWLIVEDTNLGGPYWGLQAFLSTQPEDAWVRQPQCERLLLTFNPYGYWRRA